MDKIIDIMQKENPKMLKFC